MIKLFTKRTNVTSISFILIIAILSMSFTNPGKITVSLTAGTPIQLATMNSISSAKASVGQLINFTVVDDIVAEGEVVIEKGSIATGQIERVNHAKGLGKAGFVEVRIKSVQTVDGQNVFLSDGNVYKEGADNSTTAILLGVLICILFLTMKGGEAYIPSQYVVNAMISTNAQVVVSKEE